jgi:hypothetical protein
MLTLDASGNIGTQAIPSGGSFAGLTGNPSDNAALDAALNGKLPLTGGILTGALGVTVGLAESPGLFFSGDTDTGIYSSQANTIDMAMGGVARHQFQSDGSILLKGNDPWIYHNNFTIRSPSVGTISFRGGVNATDAAITCGAITSTGLMTTGGGITSTQIISTNTNGFSTSMGGNGYRFLNGGHFICPSSGIFKFLDHTVTSFNRLQLGGETSSFPSIKRNGTAINFRLANDSADCPITAEAITASGIVSGLRLLTTTGELRSPGTQLLFLTSNTNERMRIDANGNVGIGTGSPTVGLVVRRSGAPLPAIRIEDGDVTVPFTGISFSPNINANTVGAFQPVSSSSGGCAFTGFTNTTAAAYPVLFEAYHGSASPTAPAVCFAGFKTNGSTGATTLASNELLAGFYNGSIVGSPVVTISAAGNVAATSFSTAGSLTSGFQTLVADPSTVDVTTGLARLVKNSTSGELRYWANDGGTMKSVLLS